MILLIDGYNLLHASGVIPSQEGPATLERAREALLAHLGRLLSEVDRQGTVIVFDAVNAPPGVPDRYTVHGITVLFARGYPSADAMMGELIRDATAPRKLTVVSSDHQVQRAARRRRARAVDSDRWIRETSRPDGPATPSDQKPQAPLSEDEIAHWMSEFEQNDD